MNELKELFALAGDAGAVIVLALSALGIVRSLVAIADIWARTTSERNAIDEKRNEVDDKMTLTLLQVVATQERIVEKLNTNDLRVSKIGTIVNGAVKSMNESADASREQLEELPGRIREKMSQDFERLPLVIQQALAPQIESLRGSIESLTSKIEATTDAIPTKTANMMRSDIEQLYQVVEDAITRAVTETIKLVNNTPSPQGDTNEDTDKNKPQEA